MRAGDRHRVPAVARPPDANSASSCVQRGGEVPRRRRRSTRPWRSVTADHQVERLLVVAVLVLLAGRAACRFFPLRHVAAPRRSTGRSPAVVVGEPPRVGERRLARACRCSLREGAGRRRSCVPVADLGGLRAAPATRVRFSLPRALREAMRASWSAARERHAVVVGVGQVVDRARAWPAASQRSTIGGGGRRRHQAVVEDAVGAAVRCGAGPRRGRRAVARHRGRSAGQGYGRRVRSQSARRRWFSLV
ncbi:hypothetical protein STENM223S_04242 [Streptomyces tendae]